MLVTMRNTRLILVYKGYHFSRNYCQGLKIRWQCINRTCEAHLYSVGNKIAVTHPVHNHLAIISQNSTSGQSFAAGPETVYSLEEAITAMTDPVSFFNQGTDPNFLSAAETDTMTLSYDHDSQNTSNQAFNCIKNTTQTMTSSSEINISNNYSRSVAHVVVSAGNTIIHHDPSLEITLRSTSVRPENTNDEMASIEATTFTSAPDPLAICVTSYAPTSPNDCSSVGIPDTVLNSKSNFMTVPKDVKVKVTLTSKPQASDPRVFYDGKLAPARTAPVKRKLSRTTKPNNETTCAPVTTNAPIGTVYPSAANAPTVNYALTAIDASTATDFPTVTSAPTANNAPTITYVPIVANAPTAKPRRGRGRPVISIPRSQIVSGSDPQYSHLYNYLLPQALTPAPKPKVPTKGPTGGTQVNLSLPFFAARTSSSPRLQNFRQTSHNSTVSNNLAQNTFSNQTSSNFPRSIPRFSIARVSIPAEPVYHTNIQTTKSYNQKSS